MPIATARLDALRVLIAHHDTVEEAKRMGAQDRLRQILNNISGVESLTVTESQDRQRMTIEIGGRTADVPVEATDNEIRAAFRLPQIEYALRSDMPTIGEQLKAAKAQIADARKSAADAVADTADATRVVLAEVDKAKKEAADLRAEVAELTNGGPV